MEENAAVVGDTVSLLRGVWLMVTKRSVKPAERFLCHVLPALAIPVAASIVAQYSLWLGLGAAVALLLVAMVCKYYFSWRNVTRWLASWSEEKDLRLVMTKQPSVTLKDSYAHLDSEVMLVNRGQLSITLPRKLEAGGWKTRAPGGAELTHALGTAKCSVSTGKDDEWILEPGGCDEFGLKATVRIADSGLTAIEDRATQVDNVSYVPIDFGHLEAQAVLGRVRRRPITVRLQHHGFAVLHQENGE